MAKKIRRRQILILNYKAISRKLRRRDKKEPMGSSTVVYGKIEHKVRDETKPRETNLPPTKGLLVLCMKLERPTTSQRLKTTLYDKQVTIMKGTPNHICSRMAR
jgi:hypothetical protein